MDKHKIIFAGAGPGDPELISVKAMKALEDSDLVIYAGSLVPESVLCWKGEQTKTVSSADMNLDQIISIMQAGYNKGKKVVRLHTGDPSLYGAIFEQIRRLKQLDIPFEVIPGITAAFAASARMNMEYTLPENTQTLILTRISGRTPVPEDENLDLLASHKASLAIYLSIGHAEKVQGILEKHYGEDSACAIAYKVSHPDEKIIFIKTKEIAAACKQNNISRHALIIAGRCVDSVLNQRDIADSKLYDSAFSHGYRQSNP